MERHEKIAKLEILCGRLKGALKRIEAAQKCAMEIDGEGYLPEFYEAQVQTKRALKLYTARLNIERRRS